MTNNPRLTALGDTPGSDVCGCGRAMFDTCSHLRALREIYWLLRDGESDNALHALDAYLIQNGVNPEDYAGVVVLPLGSA